MIRFYAYLRASTKEQDATRARSALSDFAQNHKITISAWFEENESGASLKRPELFRLLDVAQENDVLLIEQVDRISRLNSADWEQLKQLIIAKGVRVVALDLPTSHAFINHSSDDFTSRMMQALNAMLLDVLAAVARKDYEDQKRRQAEGIKQAQKLGRYKGRKVDTQKHKHIEQLLKAKTPWREIEKLVPCSRSTISKVKKQLNKT